MTTWSKEKKKEYMREWHKNNVERRRETAKKWYQKNKDKVKKSSAIYREKNRAKAIECVANSFIKSKKETPIQYAAYKLYHAAKYRAKKKGLVFDLTKDWILEKLNNGVCEASGLKIQFSQKYSRTRHAFSEPFSPSLDKIDPKGGYTKDNTQLVVWIYNAAKSAFTHEDVLILANALVNKNSKEQQTNKQ
jgi:hypothetical protein